MVSALGPSAVAAIGLTNQPKFIGLTIFFGINVAVSALVARRKGEQRQETANQILLTAIILGCVACVAVSALFVAFAPWMMEVAGSNAETHEAAVTYFRIIMGGTFFNVITMAMHTRPAPISLHNRRKGRSETPAIGPKIMLLSRVTLPI